MFLEASPPRVKTRSRLENLLLLILRCLAFLLLALCFTRPFLSFKSQLSGEEPGQRTVLLVDTSASMRRAGMQETIRQRVSEILERLASKDRLAVMTFSNKVRRLVDYPETTGITKEKRDELVMQRLAGANPDWGGSRLGTALVAAVEAITEDEAREGTNASNGGKILLLGDLQEGSVLEELNTFHWPENITVALEPVEADATSNAGLLLAASSEEASDMEKNQTQVRIWNAADSETEKFTLAWQGNGGDEAEIYVPAGRSRIVRAPAKPGPGASVLLLSGDEEEFDNRLYIAPQLPRSINIVYVGNQTEDGPQGSLFYLQKVFQPSRFLLPKVTAFSQLPKPEDFRATDVQLAIAESPVAEVNLEPLAQYLAAGRTLLYILNDENDLGGLQQLANLKSEPLPPLAKPEATEGQYQLIEELNTRHPVLSSFAEPRFRDFTKVHFWKHRTWPESAFSSVNVLARFDNGSPALVEIPTGQGSILVLTSSWRPEDSQLAVSTKFVPLLFSILEHSAGRLAQKARFATGDTVPIPQNPVTNAIMKPDGNRITIGKGQKTFAGTDTPGIYRMVTAAGELTFAVNIPPEESRTQPMEPRQLEQLGVLFTNASTTKPDERTKKSKKPFAEIENQQKLWKWLLAAACVLFLMETWLAGRMTRPTQTTQEG
jgi:hypothetical protein